MRTQILQKAAALFIAVFFIHSANAQDPWTPSVLDGFGNSLNYSIKAVIPFKGMLYAGAGSNAGVLYRSPNGNPGGWVNVFSATNVTSIDALGTTGDGGGYIYLSGYAYGADVPKIYRSADGVAWSNYYQSANAITHIEAFKGTGTTDSIYLFEDNYYGTIIHRSGYNTNDPLDTAASWQTVLDFTSLSPYTRVNATLVQGGKLYMGTSDAKLWSTTNGSVWVKNDSVNGFGNPNTYAITALGAFMGYIYAGTYNNIDGPEIWRSSDELNWTRVGQFPGYERITDFAVAGGEMWASIYGYSSAKSAVVRSTDGITFTFSSNDGFGYPNNHGDFGSLTLFGNNLYFGQENYGYAAPASHSGPMERGIGYSTGGQLWRYCFGTAPTLNLGADQTVCSGIPVTLDAGIGATAYYWNTGDLTQTTIATSPGNYFCNITNAAGCSISDTIKIINTPAPIVLLGNPPPALCKGTSIPFANSANSNIRNPLPEVSSVVNDSIHDYTTTLDSIAISGVSDLAPIALLSVTLDSLYHGNDGDLYITLYAPNGSATTLSAYRGYGSSNFIGTVFSSAAANSLNSGAGPFTGTYKPDQLFNSLTGPSSGTWKLNIYDSYGGNSGVLKGWSLKFSVADTILTFSWSPAAGLSSTSILNPVATPPASTNYVLTTTNIIGCSSTDTVSLYVPSIAIAASSSTACFGSSVTLAATGSGVINNWSPTATLNAAAGDTVIASPTVGTEYYLSDTVSGCYIIDSIYINANPFMSADPGLSQTICYADTIFLSGSATGGTPGYTYFWNDGTYSATGQNIAFNPLTNKSMLLTVTDAAGCTASNSMSIFVIPSKDIYGHVTYTGGNVTNGTAVIYPYKPYYIHFDSLQVQPLDASGNYHFVSINHGDYLIKVFADTLAYPTLNPTYVGNEWAWDSAAVVIHDCDFNDTADVIMNEEIGTGGPGFLRGRITEDVGFGRTPGDPIPGVDVHLGKNPGGAAFFNTTTNAAGYYTFNSVALNSPGEYYTVYVDIPGLKRDSSYNVVVDATNNQFLYLDYIVDSTSIYIVPTAGAGVSNPAMAAESKFKIYPNPFTSITGVEYSITKESNVKLEVYNVLGTKIKTLANGKQQEGDYKFELNAQTEKLGSGIYFISLVIDGNKTTQRVVVVD